MIFTMEIYRPSRVSNDGRVVVHHREDFDLETERDAAMVLVATRERLPAGYIAGMTYKAASGTRTNVRVRS